MWLVRVVKIKDCLTQIQLQQRALLKSSVLYADSYFINANSGTAPGIVDADRQPILDRSEVYSGVYAIAYTLKMSYKSDYKIEGFLNMLCHRWKVFGGRKVQMAVTIAVKWNLTGYR